MAFTRSDALAMDAADPVAESWRGRFRLPQGRIYLDGNSLGALPATSAASVATVVEEEWGRDLISSWNRHDWTLRAARVGDRIGALLGARAGQTIVCDSVSVNLFKLIGAALAARPERRTIVAEAGNFPTDLYMARAAAGAAGDRSVRTAVADGIVDAIDADTALVVLTHVHYRSGVRLDMHAINAAAHERGALVLWDLSHSAGAVPISLDAWDTDLAVGCGYKYLNGGPGAPAWLYVAARHLGRLASPLPGWFGHAAPFVFEEAYRPAAGIERFLCGTPGIIGLAALSAGVGTFDGVGLEALFARGEALGSLFVRLMRERCGDHGFELASPEDASARGSHVSFAHREAHAICRALIARDVVGDFRAPDLLRMGFAPLYNRFVDVWDAVAAIVAVMEASEWNREEHRIPARVT